jgi:hypothetical protein
MGGGAVKGGGGEDGGVEEDVEGEGELAVLVLGWLSGDYMGSRKGRGGWE